MKLYSENENYKLYHGDMLDMLEVIEPNSIDAIVTDPPYELTSITQRYGKENSKPNQYGKDGSFARLARGFMGKQWDGSGISYNVEAWRKCYEVLKSGGYLLAFGGTRTFHRIACAIEDAGFEIRDTIMWLYGSGFPKSMSISKGIEAKEKLGNAGTRNKRLIEQASEGETYIIKQTNNGAMGEVIETTRKDYKEGTELAKKWKGWGTTLKPSYEPIIIARKPVENTVIDNVIKYGVGGLNIDECRVPLNGEEITVNVDYEDEFQSEGWGTKKPITNKSDSIGRFPANTILTYDDSDFDEVCGGMPSGTQNGSIRKPYKMNNLVYGEYGNCNTFNAYQDSGSAARYFYCAKTSKKDRDDGLEEFEESKINDGYVRNNQETARTFGANPASRKNIHPTVKPMELMQYLIRLVSPKGATILDCFNGSGSTGKAVMYENAERDANYKYIGIEITDEYLPISKARIESVFSKQTQTKLF